MSYPSTDFPVALDTLNQIGPGGQQTPNGSGETHPGLHAQLAAAVAALQTKVGIDNSADPTSLDYKVRNNLGDVVALVDGANIATDASLGNAFDVTIAGNRTLDNPTNPSDGQLCTWRVKQGAGGSRLLSYGGAFNFGAAGAPTLSTTVGKVDNITARYNASLVKWCVELVALGF